MCATQNAGVTTSTNTTQVAVLCDNSKCIVPHLNAYTHISTQFVHIHNLVLFSKKLIYSTKTYQKQVTLSLQPSHPLSGTCTYVIAAMRGVCWLRMEWRGVGECRVIFFFRFFFAKQLATIGKIKTKRTCGYQESPDCSFP